MFSYKTKLAATCLLACLALTGCDEDKLTSAAPINMSDVPIPNITERSFRMGFTLWPSDLTEEGIKISRNFAYQHGDLISVMFFAGIPWPEALENKPFSKDVQNHMSYQPPKGKKLFLSISLLANDRNELAPYWGEKDNMPLPREWRNLPLNDPKIKKAYLAFTLRSIKAMQPAYLAIGVESNVLLSNNYQRWLQLKELHKETYLAVKKQYPALPVFFTTELLHYKKLHKEAKNSPQEAEVDDLMQYSDYFAMSVYPFMSYEIPRPVPDDFLDVAKRFNKPIVVSEAGFTSQDVRLKTYGITLYGSEKEQAHFTNMVLKKAHQENYVFVANFATTDYEKLSDKLPNPVAELSRIWSRTGLQTSNQISKPALTIWDGYYNAPLTKP